MSLTNRRSGEIPQKTKELGDQLLKDKHAYRVLRESLGVIYEDKDFADLFDRRGPEAESPGLLAMVLVLQFAEGLTDRQAANAIQTRIDWKYLLGLELTDPGFDASVLSEFRRRLAESDAGRRLLERMLVVFENHGLLKGSKKQRTDSTHVLANVRDLDRLELVGEALRHTLNTLAEIVPEWLLKWIDASWFERYGERVDERRLPKSEAAREALRLQIGIDGAHLLQHIFTDPDAKCLRAAPAVDALRQIWIQNFCLQDDDEDGTMLQVSWRASGNIPKSATMITSPYDLQARYSTKREMGWIGYKVHLSETCVAGELSVITHVLTTPATTSDQSVVGEIHAGLKASGLKPDEHLVDCGYMSAEMLVSSRDEGIEMIGEVRQDTTEQGRAGLGYALANFDINWEAQMVTCPQGRQSRYWHKRGQSHLIRFDPQDCQHCSARKFCCLGNAPARYLKLQSRREYEALANARIHQTTHEFKSAYKARSGVEAAISQGVRACELRKCRYKSLVKTAIQHFATAAAINFRRLAAWLVRTPGSPTKRPLSPFAKLAVYMPVT